MRTILEPAPWHNEQPHPDLIGALDLIAGTWSEAASNFYAERMARLRAGRPTPKGIQKYLNKVLDTRFEEAGWEVNEGRYTSDHVWLRITFRHQMSLGSDLLDALKVHVREGIAQVAIVAAPFRFLELISPNDKHVLTSFEKLRVETASLKGCLDIPLFIGRLEPQSELPIEVERFLRQERPRGKVDC